MMGQRQFQSTLYYQLSQLASLNLTRVITEVKWGTSFTQCSDNDVAKATRRQL